MEQKDKPFIVKSEKAFGALRHWLKERGCNTYSSSRADIINVGYDTKPDSGWGGKYTPRGFILIKDSDLYDRTCKEIEDAFRKNGAWGWTSSAA
jgi:hypothetical protein